MSEDHDKVPVVNYLDTVTAAARMASPDAGIRDAAAEAVTALLGGADPALDQVNLSDLVFLQAVIEQLQPKLREAIASAVAAFADRAAVEVPLEGPVAACDERVVYHLRVFSRTSLDAAVTTCPGHLHAHLNRVRHRNPGSQAIPVILAFSTTRTSRCGDFTDYRRLLNDPS